MHTQGILESSVLTLHLVEGSLHVCGYTAEHSCKYDTNLNMKGGKTCGEN